MKIREFYSLVIFPLTFLVFCSFHVETYPQIKDFTRIVWKPEWIKYQDSLTGREVWQITSHDSVSAPCYFENQAFTADEKFLVFTSKRTGAWEIYSACLENGEITALTKFCMVSNPRYTINPAGTGVCFINEWILYKIDIDDLLLDTLMNFSGLLPAKPRFSASFTNDGRYTLVSASPDSVQMLYRVDLSTKQLRLVLGKSEGRFSHPLICPTDPDIITYVPGPDTQNNMSLPMQERARTWKIDLSKDENKPFLVCPYGYRATHESWSKNGERFYFYRKTVPGWKPVTISSINKNGKDYKGYFTSDTIRLGHGSPDNDEKWFISDSQDPWINPLMLINLKSQESHIICWTNSSIAEGLTEFTHVHPFFSPTGKYVCFTSDRTGVCQVYVVPVEDLINK
jgi:Tol biopolymer transport system component